MFQIGLTIICAVFVMGYIFFSTGSEAEDASLAKDVDNNAPLSPAGQDAA